MGADASPTARAALLRVRAIELGFDAVGIASVAPLEAREHYAAWLAADRHGGMAWLASPKHRQRREDPERLLRPLRAVLCVAMTHPPERDAQRDQRIGRIARYAAGEDYHRVMHDHLLTLERYARSLVPGSRALWYADTGAILERGWAERAGLGWIGKHTGVLSQGLGSWFLLGEVLLDYDVPADAPVTEHCGRCTRCIDACPTRAIVAPYQLDARLCISYLTIEHQGVIPRELRPAIGDWIFGCDICQEVCPWNRFAPPAREARLHARDLTEWSLERFLSLDEATFHELFATSPIRRAGRDGFLRNVCVALGNRGDASAIPPLAAAVSADPSPLVRAHAAWALGEIARREPAVRARVDAALAAAASDPESSVREEALAADAGS
jgi:epoxyqueuosine reductase